MSDMLMFFFAVSFFLNNSFFFAFTSKIHRLNFSVLTLVLSTDLLGGIQHLFATGPSVSSVFATTEDAASSILRATHGDSNCGWHRFFFFFFRFSG